MPCLHALDKFVSHYHAAYMQSLGEPARFYALGEASECIIGEPSDLEKAPVYWQAIKREESGEFSNVESALEIELHQDISPFYGRYFSAPLKFDSEWGEGELLQAWNDDDFNRLQQNIIGHLMMKRKLKQPLTWFIGVLDKGDVMLTVDNHTGAVSTEIPGELQGEVLADNLADFLTQLNVKIAPPEAPIEDEVAMTHPGMINRFKRMWHNLIGK